MLTGQVWVSIFVNTLTMASMYIMAALGFAFIFNMLGTINLAHGSIYMISAYLLYALFAYVGLPTWLSLLIAAVVMAGFGLLLEKFAIRPFQDDFDRIIMVGVALMTIMSTTATLISGTKQLAIPSFATGQFQSGIFVVSKEKVVMFVIGIVILAIVLFIVNKTKLGKQMKAVSQDQIGAALQGIPIYKVAGIVCAIGCAIAAIAGGLMGAYQGLSTGMGDTINLRILMLVLLAGAGSMNGIIITGLIMAFLDSFFPVIVQGTMASALALLVVIILLLIKPKGFFGHEV